MTPEQKAEAAEEARRKKELEAQAKEQRRKDQALLDTYTSIQDIDRAQAKAESETLATIKDVTAKIESIRKQRKKFELEAEFYKNRALPPEIAKGLRGADHELKTQRDLLDAKNAELAAIRTKFDGDRRRYGELTGRPLAPASPTQPIPPPGLPAR